MDGSQVGREVESIPWGWKGKKGKRAPGKRGTAEMRCEMGGRGIEKRREERRGKAMKD